jgi:hypothetical protein
MSKTSCTICKKEFENDRKLHSHLKAHKIRMVEYYQTHYARHDLYDGKIIKFKNKQQYFTSDFNNRGNLKKWLIKTDKAEAQGYCTDLLKKRKNKKKLIYAPTEIELRTTMMPPIHYYNKLFGDYYKLCEEVGLIPKYVEPNEQMFPKSIDYESLKEKNISVYVDTREQKPYKLNLPIDVTTLKYGDYTLSDSEICGNLHIERKSIVDFIGTLSGGYERFKREIERAKEADANLVVLTEDTLDHCLAFKNLPYVSKKIRVTPEFVFHNVRELIQEYPHIQFLFTKGKIEAARVAEVLLLSRGWYDSVDLQNAYDIGML